MHLSNAKGKDQGVTFFYSQLKICGFLLQNTYYNCKEKMLSSPHVGREKYFSGQVLSRMLPIKSRSPCFSSCRSWGWKPRVCSRHTGLGCEPHSHMQTRTAVAVVPHVLLASVLTRLHLGAGLPGAMVGPDMRGNLGEWSWMRKAGFLVQWEEHWIQIQACIY